VDTHEGQVLHSTLFHARRVPLQTLLAEQFPNVTQIDHDACFGALAESDEGAAKDASHFIYFAINHNRVGGVTRVNSFGSALFLEGRVYRGAHFAAGELAAGLKPRGDLLADEPDLACLAQPDADLTPTLQVLAQSVGSTLADIVNLLDVEMVVIGGNCNIANASFLRAVQTQTELMLIPVPGRTIQVIGSKLGDDTVARGAAIASCRAALEGGAFLSNSRPTNQARRSPMLDTNAMFCARTDSWTAGRRAGRRTST
jgi:predicted NBD/HSP70 family sugar kinase